MSEMQKCNEKVFSLGFYADIHGVHGKVALIGNYVSDCFSHRQGALFI